MVFFEHKREKNYKKCPKVLSRQTV
jgi:hypothetical protein